jgi:hypothetical protein
MLVMCFVRLPRVFFQAVFWGKSIYVRFIVPQQQ